MATCPGSGNSCNPNRPGGTIQCCPGITSKDGTVGPTFPCPGSDPTTGCETAEQQKAESLLQEPTPTPMPMATCPGSGNSCNPNRPGGTIQCCPGITSKDGTVGPTFP